MSGTDLNEQLENLETDPNIFIMCSKKGLKAYKPHRWSICDYMHEGGLAEIKTIQKTLMMM